MKKFYILLSFLCFAGNGILQLNAQDVHITWGNVAKQSRIAQTLDIIGRDASGFYVLTRNGDLYLEKYDNQSNQIFQKELSFPSPEGKKVLFEKLLMIDGQML